MTIKSKVHIHYMCPRRRLNFPISLGCERSESNRIMAMDWLIDVSNAVKAIKCVLCSDISVKAFNPILLILNLLSLQLDTCVRWM